MTATAERIAFSRPRSASPGWTARSVPPLPRLPRLATGRDRSGTGRPPGQLLVVRPGPPGREVGAVAEQA